MKVLKFGGTSVGSPERMKQLLDRGTIGGIGHNKQFSGNWPGLPGRR
jgi:hypothetical protein